MYVSTDTYHLLLDLPKSTSMTHTDQRTDDDDDDDDVCAYIHYPLPNVILATHLIQVFPAVV